MTRLTDPIASSNAPSNAGSPLSGVPVADERSIANTIREGLAGKQVCPFCGTQNPASTNANTNSTGPCPRCTMEDTAATRQATKARIGPWHVLQTRNPAAPGMRFATLLALVGKGQVTARSVVRGPTTHQLWRYGAHVKGLSREFGVCYSCGESIDKTASHCSHCDRAQEPVGNPDALLEAREPVVAIAPSAPNLSLTEGTTSDPYAIIARPISEQPMLSHADRLRNGSDVRPIDSRTDIRRRPDGRALSAMELAAALQVAPPQAPVPESHPVRTLLVTMSVVAILAAMIIGYARPDLRRVGQDWLVSTSASIEQTVKNFHLQKRPPSDQYNPSTEAGGSANGSGSAWNPPVNTSPVSTPSVDTPQASTPAIVPTAPPPTDIAGTTPAHETPAPAPTPEVQVTVSHATPPANPVTPPPAQPTPVATVQSSQDDATAHPSVLPDRPVLVGGPLNSTAIWALRSRGLDAEGKQDWAQAVQCYQQIESAPKDLWPSDIKIRLENAQRQLGK